MAMQEGESMKTKRSKFAAVVVIVLALLASVTLIAGCVAIPTTTPTREPTSLSTHTPAPASTETPVPPPANSRPTPNPQPLPTNEQDCLKQGGTWGPQGRAQQNMCDLPTTDAGQPCIDSSQCEGTCLAGEMPSIGTCSPRRVNFGCYTVMKDGMQIGLCVD
jgi:hypothetical protein